ncbi:MAG: TetR/AcrR family transcriptional regulator [Stackebrandtia sp.]
MSEPRNTRERIQQVAMELFSQQGYDRTSLREIAEHLNVTKAALYYHFKTKEDIAASYFDDFNADVDKLYEWAAAQPSGIETRREILRRYSDVMNTNGQTLRFIHHNQPALREIGKGKNFKDRMNQLSRLLVSPDATPLQRLRGVDAIMTMHVAWFVELEGDPDPAELRAPALRIALELIEANEKPD